MPNDELIKESIEILRKSRYEVTWDAEKASEYDTALQKLLDLANAYLKVGEGMPEENLKYIYETYLKTKVVPFSADGSNAVKLSDAVDAIKQALHDCKLAVVKMIPTTKEIEDIIATNCRECVWIGRKEFAQSLHSFLEKKMGGVR